MKYLIFSMPQFSPRENASSPLLDFYEGEIWQYMQSAQNSAWHAVSFQRRSVVMTKILPRVACMESGKSTGLWVRRPDLYSSSAAEQAVWPWANPSPLWAFTSSRALGLLISRVLPCLWGKGRHFLVSLLFSPSVLALGSRSLCSDMSCPPWIWCGSQV